MWQFVFALLTPALAGTEIAFEYVYDVARDETPTVSLHAGGADVVQPVFAPEGITRLAGVRLKVQRTGRPGALSVQVVRETTGRVIGSGRIPDERISSLFEFWRGPDFDPVDVTPGERLLLRVRVEGRPEEPSAGRKASCLLFGARQGCYFGTPVNIYGTEQLCPKRKQTSFPVRWQCSAES